jgi:hypothetical protein
MCCAAFGPSSDLADWAARAGHAVTRSEASNAAVLWSHPGGEIRYYGRMQDDQRNRMTRSNREQYGTFAADRRSALPVVEACRRREHDDQLIYPPGDRRGRPI